MFTPSGDMIAPPMACPVSFIDTLRDPDHDWRVCHVDGIAFRDPATTGWAPSALVEGKTAGRDDPEKWGEDETDEVPDDYLVQCHHNGDIVEKVTGYSLPVDIPLLSGGYGGHKVRVFTIHPEPGFRRDLLALEVDFWHHVTHDIPPRVEPTERGRKSVSKLFPEDDGEERLIPLDSPVHPLGVEAKEADAEYKLAKARREAAFAVLQEAQGETRKFDGIGWRTNYYTVTPKPKVDWEAVARSLARDLGREGPSLLLEATQQCLTEPKPYRTFRFTAVKGG